MAREKRPPLPNFLSTGPLEALDRFNSMVESFQDAVNFVDRSLGSIDDMTSQVDKRLAIAGPKAVPGPPEVEPKPHEHLSYEGQSDLLYCLECGVKHSQTAKVLMREAIQRAEAGSPSGRGVLEKVRGVVEELVGLEDDTDQRPPYGRPAALYEANEKVSALNSLARTLRKFIYAKRAEIGGASLEDLREIRGLVDKLVDSVYTVLESEECIGCTVEDVCRGIPGCVEFVEERVKGVKDPEAIRKVLLKARERYGRG